MSHFCLVWFEGKPSPVLSEVKGQAAQCPRCEDDLLQAAKEQQGSGEQESMMNFHNAGSDLWAPKENWLCRAAPW